MPKQSIIVPPPLDHDTSSTEKEAIIPEVSGLQTADSPLPTPMYE